MNKYNSVSKGTKAGLIVSMILMIISLIINVFSIGVRIEIGRMDAFTIILLNIIVAVLTLVYSIAGYKKPHGNMLKWLLFTFGLSIALHGTVDVAAKGRYLSGDLSVLAGFICAYVSGRLGKIKKNRIILVLVWIILFAEFVLHLVTGSAALTFVNVIGRMSQLFIFSVISYAYLARFEEHRAAGLEE